MGDRFYRAVRFIGSFGLWVSARPRILGVEHIPGEGPFILAATHQSYFDVPLLIRHTPRLLDFVSITEVFSKPLVGWFYGSLNAFPLERSRADPATVRTILDRLSRARAVAMFPEGRLRPGPESVVHTGRIRPGIGRLAQLANVPIIPCVVWNSAAYTRPLSWAPLRRTRYTIVYGPAIHPAADSSSTEQHLITALQQLWRTADPVCSPTQGQSSATTASS